MSLKQKKNLVRIIVSSVLLAAVCLLPADGVFRLLLFIVPYLIAGWDVLFSAVRNIIRGQVFDENFLMALATIGAFFISEYPEAVFVMLFYQVGELFQSIAVGKSRRSISALMDIRPDRARVIREGCEIIVSPEEVQAGEVILITPGERIPLDGTVIEGSAFIDTSSLTGESLPREAGPGDSVISGTINQSGVIRVRTCGTYSESTVARILELTLKASSKKARAENFITKFARYYTPAVVISAVCLAVLVPLISGTGWSEWLHRALIFLVVSCPCALVISIPLSFFGGIGGASKKGILIKGASYIETLSHVKTVVFDKTGTLTKGNFSVSEIIPEGETEAQELLRLAALTESRSGHPIALSIREAYMKTSAEELPGASEVNCIEEEAGLGITAVIDGKRVAVGNGRLMEKEGIKYTRDDKTGTVVYVSRDGDYMGHIVISDEIKADSREAVRRLKTEGGCRTVMLTGDVKSVGEAVGRELDIDEIYTELMPDDKAGIVEEMLLRKAKGTTLAFVGDGVNDAPVLSIADVGLAMGALGSDAAIEAADVVLMNDRISDICTAVRISRATMKIVKENIVFALTVKLIVLLLGALGLANMWLAVFADVGVMVISILNSLRTLR